MIKVDFCSDDCADSVGGPYAWIQRLPPQLRRLGISVRIRLLSWQDPSSGAAFQSLKRDNFEVAAQRFQDTASNVRWLLEQTQPHPPDVFVANHVVPALFAGRYLREAGIPIIGVLRSDDSFYWALYERFGLGKEQDRVNGLVCVSEFLARKVAQRLPPAIQLRKIPSGTPVPSQTATAAQTTLRIAYVGRMVEEQKRVLSLARALARVTREVSGVEAFLYGDGPERPQVERILAEEHASSVHVAGSVPNEQLQAQLLEAHAIVLLSDYEGTPIALMEGMACGCVPVCLWIRSGIPELVEHGVTGLVVDDRGDSFVNAVRRLRMEPGLWERLSVAARARIENGYSIESCARRWAELLHSLHDNRGPKRPIHIPRRIKLPPPHPGFGGQDPRPHRPPFPVRFYRRARITAGRWRRRLLGQPIP
ncbi:MAG TPA: glycosyltransferase family 4 protein [Verrucomicrobiota bacterium]|jgi:glycosyltransferase involved in cell wall biosynthesis|nr:glycosyltransferase family 4 protein [Verrucomicrobiota bacterium]OQC27379.1 MAG: Alpha-D-kanosaminyltransferase [Verrucomicrobia bacterium ADurb.Bin063]HRR65910.1 glycosyltransferase family 4 protein [Candidatus Paceibacterota bacterium]NLH83791.1 glycosyltransferase family 4 protein [Verrucomicrobiota bacterium]HNR72364.1 glycosyltransferase family 4 protein [Verrucomicrobiota bacterium]